MAANAPRPSLPARLRWKLLRKLRPEERWIPKLPLFISFPRTGSEWLNCVMELYFDRPRLRSLRITFLPPERTDWMWFHDHDHRLTLQHSNVLYLYRRAPETVYSYMVYDYTSRHPEVLRREERIDPLEAPEEVVRRYCEAYQAHLRKWLQGPQRARTAITYEQLMSDREATFRRICAHFGEPFEVDRMQRAFAVPTKEAMVKVASESGGHGMQDHVLEQDYKARRGEFITQWAPLWTQYYADIDGALPAG